MLDSVTFSSSPASLCLSDKPKHLDTLSTKKLVTYIGKRQDTQHHCKYVPLNQPLLKLSNLSLTSNQKMSGNASYHPQKWLVYKKLFIENLEDICFQVLMKINVICMSS